MDNPVVCRFLGTVGHGDEVRFWVVVGEVAEVAEGFLGDWEVLACGFGWERGGRTGTAAMAEESYNRRFGIWVWDRELS